MDLCYDCGRYIIPGSTDWSACQCPGPQDVNSLTKPLFWVIQKEAFDSSNPMDTPPEYILGHYGPIYAVDSSPWFAPAGLPRGSYNDLTKVPPGYRVIYGESDDQSS